MPKGAMISHKNFTANIKGAVDNDFPLNENDTIISYLPLAH
jgi:long-subunit acyl-CoA synthetase (AMP-forming)